MAVTVEKGYKVAKLICVTGDNNNKYYNMTQINDQEFEAAWGRVDVTESKKNYPMSQWDKIYREKTSDKKGYKDVTSFRTEVVNESASGTKSNGIFHDKRTPTVKSFVEQIMKFANQSVEQNYTVSANRVTQAQVDEAQRILDIITKSFKVGADAKNINQQLIELYQVIPRKMKKVQDHLIQDGSLTKTNLKHYQGSILMLEQDALDAMAGQVSMNIADKNATTEQKKEHDILHTLGLELSDCVPGEIKMIKDLMGPNAGQFSRAYRATNNESQSRYDKWMKSVSDPKKDLLWHGSRNENWWSIFQQGLKIRPSNAVLTGAMFGNGIYFADKAQKSIGYTSLSGSYWARGDARKAVLALYEIHQGKQMIIERHKSEHCSLDRSIMLRKGYDSVFAKGGYDLRNNEYIVYDVAQCTIKFLVEISQ